MNRWLIIATLQGWLDGNYAVSREDVRQLLLDCGYVEEPASDDRTVLLFYKTGWRRWSLIGTEGAVPVEYQQQIAETLIPLLLAEA